MPNKRHYAYKYVGQQEHPGVAALLNGVVSEQRIESRVNRAEIVPPDFVTEDFGSRLAGSADKEIHKSDRRYQSHVA